MSQILQKTEVTGAVAEPGFTHNGTHPLIERICQLQPRVILTLFPTRERPLLNVRISSLLATTHESEVRFELVVERFPESIAILLVAVAILELIVTILPVIVEIVAVLVARLPERLAISIVIPFIVPLRAFCALVLVK